METQEREIDLKEIFEILLSKLKFIILLTMLGFVAAFFLAKVLMPVKYTSSVSIYVKNTTGQGQGAATVGDLSAAKDLAETYIVILNDDILYEQVGQMLIEDYNVDDLKRFFTVEESDGKYSIPAEEIRKKVVISSVNNTEVINIKAETTSANISADICTYISDSAPELLTRVTKAGSVETIGTAKVPNDPSSPNVKKISVIGGLLGLFVAIAAVVIMHMLDSCISSADDIRQRFKIPVLAEIPDLELDLKGGK